MTSFSPPKAKTGLQIARDHHPDLVVLDLTMPDIDGLEVCKALRSEPRHARLPILVLSARASAADRILGLERGADDYLIKPSFQESLPRESRRFCDARNFIKWIMPSLMQVNWLLTLMVTTFHTEARK